MRSAQLKIVPYLQLRPNLVRDGLREVGSPIATIVLRTRRTNLRPTISQRLLHCLPAIPEPIQKYAHARGDVPNLRHSILKQACFFFRHYIERRRWSVIHDNERQPAASDAASGIVGVHFSLYSGNVSPPSVTFREEWVCLSKYHHLLNDVIERADEFLRLARLWL
jgi:hypothetical protein